MVAANYFDNLFTIGTCSQIDDCLNTMPYKLTPEMQQELTCDFIAEEIKDALFQMGPTKAPRPDGMNALFFQKFWHVVGGSVINAVLDYFNSSVMDPAINHTHIVLIPKIKLILHGISGLNASTSVNCGWWRKAYKTNINSEGRSG